MRTRRSGEEGMALLVVMVLMGVMMTAGFAIASTVDTQTRASQAERVRDSAFNLAESALHAQVFALTRDWPGLGRSAEPYTTCTPASGGSRCPDNASLVAGGSPDLRGATWTTSVRDNGGAAGSFYSDASSASEPGYDANNDGNVWVRAQAVTQGRIRTLVVLVRSETQEEDMPRAALIAGSFEISNSGNKELVRASNGPVAMRCDPYFDRSVACLGHPQTVLDSKPDLIATQVTGTTPVSNPSAGPAMTPEARARLKSTAIANGTYYTSCPTQLTGQVVYVEAAITCSYGGSSQSNSEQAPGALILDRASISFGGTTKFFGIIYAANTMPNAKSVQTTGNSALITGGVLIDGSAKMVVGSSGLNISFNVNAFRAVASYGAAGVVQNTWREIRAG